MQDGWKIWCIGVSDKFGDNGITGAIMVTPEGEIDTFLLSCRILGKGIETAFIKIVFTLLARDGVDTLTARYVPSAKNSQVECFWDKVGFVCIRESEDGSKSYSLALKDADMYIKPFYKITIK